jgi:DNA-binding transcriptional regulator YhcF (GntR family)
VVVACVVAAGAAPALRPAGGAGVILEIDPVSAVPTFEQMRAQIAGLVATGALPPGTRLPPIRQLAGDLGIAPGTVARAYRELEQSGLLVSRGRDGTRVTDRAERAAGIVEALDVDDDGVPLTWTDSVLAGRCPTI